MIRFLLTGNTIIDIVQLHTLRLSLNCYCRSKSIRRYISITTTLYDFSESIVSMPRLHLH